MKATVLGLIAASLFGGSQRSDQLRPDVRHWTEDLYQSAPRLEDFEDFLSDLDLDDNPQDLNEAQAKRLDNLKALETIDLSKEQKGIYSFVPPAQLFSISENLSKFAFVLFFLD